MSSRGARMSALLALALLAAACDGDGDDGDALPCFTVSCEGLTTVGTEGALTRIASRAGRRCEIALALPPAGRSMRIVAPGDAGDPGTMTLQLTYAGRTWVAKSGELTAPRHDGDRLSGVFDVVAEADGEEARVFGPIDWCDPASRADCPHGSPSGLQRTASWSTPAGFAATAEDTRAADCRMVADPVGGGLQVDLVLGVVRGVNVGLWPSICAGAALPPATLRFRAAGYTGIGSYGPFVSSGDAALPELSFGIPLTYYGSGCGDAYGQLERLTTIAGTSVCSWVVANGHFALSCTGVRDDASGGVSEGTFELAADCDLVTR